MSDQPQHPILATVHHLFKAVRKPLQEGTLFLLPNMRSAPSRFNRPLHLQIRTPKRRVERISVSGDNVIFVGRSQPCEITIPERSVSHVHARITPLDPLTLRVPGLNWRWPMGWIYTCFGWHLARYEILDEDSANGIYCKHQQVQRLPLQHRTCFSLGPPYHAATVHLRVIDPPPLILYAVRGIWGLLGLALVILGILVGQEWQKIPVDPLPTTLHGPVIVLADDGQTQLRRTSSDTHQELLHLDDFGSVLPKVVVAAEDRRFYSHWGVDFWWVLRAIVINIQAGEVQQGGSSITQQLARTILRDYTGTGNTLDRKWREAIAAFKLESHYSKEDLLTLYLNNVYMGNGLYGFEDAALFYFGIRAAELNLSEAAILAGLLPAPNAFNPLDNLEAATRSRNRVLDQLSEYKVFSEAEINRARRTRITLNPQLQSVIPTVAPYFYNAVMAELTDLLGPELAGEGNFIIETTVHLPFQQIAEQTLADAITQTGPRYGFSQGALITLNHQGEVLALVGGLDYEDSQFNRAIQAQRQPGSTFKIFAYTTALNQGFSPQQTFSCESLQWGGQTFPGCRSGSGPLTIHQGLALSENVVALRVAQQVSLNSVIDLAHQMGIRSPLQPYPTLVLGAFEVNLMELTGSFSVLANQGLFIEPHTIRRVLDSNDCYNPEVFSSCREIYPGREAPYAPQVVLRPNIAQQMTVMLRDVIRSGTGRNAQIGYGEAGKTGTTDDSKDLVFVGYLQNPVLVSGIWLGNDDSTPTRGSSGQAAQVWANYMRQILK